MIKLYSINTYTYSKSTDKLPLQCHHCFKTFYLMKKKIKWILKNSITKGKFCSKYCYGQSNLKMQNIKCMNCGAITQKKLSEIQGSKNNFCSQSCSAVYNNKHKTKGNRRSKLEQWIEKNLINQYPNLEIHFNRKDTINSELDIYIPSIKLAFELNGIFHYEPIYGQEKLNKIQNNDHRKFQACAENNISLCVIDTCSLKYFKEEKAKNYLKIINDHIHRLLVN